jgi:hypothetical protein
MPSNAGGIIMQIPAVKTPIDAAIYQVGVSGVKRNMRKSL